MTDVEMDKRIMALEENGGGGKTVNGETIVLYNSVKHKEIWHFYLKHSENK